MAELMQLLSRRQVDTLSPSISRTSRSTAPRRRRSPSARLALRPLRRPSQVDPSPSLSPSLALSFRTFLSVPAYHLPDSFSSSSGTRLHRAGPSEAMRTRESGRANSDRRGQSCNAQASCLLARSSQLFEMLCYSTLTTTTSRSHSATTALSPPSSSTAATPTSAPAPGPPTRSTICAPVRARVPAAGTGGER